MNRQFGKRMETVMIVGRRNCVSSSRGGAYLMANKLENTNKEIINNRREKKKALTKWIVIW